MDRQMATETEIFRGSSPKATCSAINPTSFCLGPDPTFGMASHTFHNLIYTINRMFLAKRKKAVNHINAFHGKPLPGDVKNT
jgi:hypothetical protein